MRHDHALEAAVGALARFIQDEPLTAKIADIEHDFDGCIRGEVGPIISARGVSPDLLRGLRHGRDASAVRRLRHT